MPITANGAKSDSQIQMSYEDCLKAIALEDTFD